MANTVLVPPAVLALLVGGDATVLSCAAEPIARTLGIATASVIRVTGRVRTSAGQRPFALIAKRLRPGNDDPRHWAYWRREALAYTSGLLPTGPGLAAPRCYGELLARLDDIPRVLCHGDFHSGQMRGRGATTVVLDWATLSAAPIGSDAAHLALSVLTDVSPAYLSGLDGCYDPAVVWLGYAVTVALTGAGRVHWMLMKGIEIPPGYVDFVLSATMGCLQA